MTLENAKTLHKHFLEIGNKVAAEQLEGRYPELKIREEVKEEVKVKEVTKEKPKKK